MASVEQERAGTASGINNAVARVAGVLAIAVLGVVAVSAFSHRLQESLTSLRLAPSVTETLRSQSIQLAALQAPSGLAPQSAEGVRAGILESFVYAFRMVMLICALLAFSSAGIAKWLIRGPRKAALLDGESTPVV
jgi:hypothetical protein